ncbi:hypothetical protein HYT23_05430 [Candidatus Pacearchaeota archaeon]|nr:hypothetical protein [Candidatus Pacearchaeota archaeon]
MAEEENRNNGEVKKQKSGRIRQVKPKKEKPKPTWEASEFEFDSYVYGILRSQGNALRRIKRRYDEVAGDIEEKMIELIGMLNAVQAARQSGDYNVHYSIGKEGFGYKLVPRECGFGDGKKKGIEKIVENPK